jgi:hypothetical protein
MNSEKYRICGRDLCGYCFPAKNNGQVKCEYLPATQQAKLPEDICKGQECRHHLIKIESQKSS